MNHEENIVIGIDLGTYNSAAAVLLGDEPVMLRAEEGLTDQGINFPSFVEFDERGEFLRAGEYARRAIHVNPERVVWGVKRLIGKSYKQAKESGDIDRFQYKVFEGRDGSCRIKVGKREYSPTEISSYILRKIKKDAEAGFNPIGKPITEAVITVPAYFGPFQKAETEQAAKMAGFNKVHLIPEPTAAALAYKLRVEGKDQYIVVIDLGAGTLDVTVALLYLDNKGCLQTEEKGHGGNTALGGLDIDDAILQHIVEKYGLRQVMKDAQGRARLRTEIERAKIKLSKDLEAPVTFSFPKGKVDIVINRQDVERSLELPLPGQKESFIARCRGPIRIALKEANLRPVDISHVLLVGGPTMMPIVQRMVMEEFAENSRVVQEISSIEHEGFPVNPMEAVARGAVLGAFSGITPHAYGILLEGIYYELIPRRYRYPCSNFALYGVPGDRRSLVLNLIQKALDPQTYQEVYLNLGVFQFDYRPEPGRTGVLVEAEYTENGVLNLRVSQLSTMIDLPLYSVSKLEGRRIPKPPTPTEEHIDRIPPRDPPPLDRLQQWSQNDLQDAIRTGNRLIPIAQARLNQASLEDRERIREIVSELKQWIGNTWEDINIRTPRIRNLNRALLNVLLANRILDPQELQELQRGIG